MSKFKAVETAVVFFVAFIAVSMIHYTVMGFWFLNTQLSQTDCRPQLSCRFYRAMLRIARTMLSQDIHLSVLPFVRLSVSHTPVFCRNG